MQCPLDYSLCDKTVTVYSLQNAQVKRQVLEGVFYNYQVTQVTDEQGRRQETKFLLIVPGESNLQPGDRVYDGIGPDITPSQWKHFLPVTVTGLSEIAYVTPYFWDNRLCHTEAGRK